MQRLDGWLGRGVSQWRLGKDATIRVRPADVGQVMMAGAKKPMRNRLFYAYLTLANTLLLLLALEGAGQLVYRVTLGHWVFSPWPGDLAVLQAFERHPYTVVRMRPGISTTGISRVDGDSVTVTATAEGTRWTGAPPRDSAQVVVATVGGSTTFGTGVNDSDTWPALLQERLGDGFAVINYGMPGFSTAEGIVQMGLIIPESDPDIVIFYEGWNDIHNYHDPTTTPDYYRYGLRQLSNLRIDRGRLDTRGFVQRGADYSAILRLVSRVSMGLRPKAKPKLSHLYGSPDTLVDRIYERNLQTLKALADHIGAYTLFVPQVLNSDRYRAIEGPDKWSPRIRNDQMPRLIRRFNEAMNRTCTDGISDCAVVDEVLDQPWTRADFIDYGHFGRRGAERFATVLAEHVRAAVAHRSSF
jgi:lysophospholipase L1-like esterase